MRKCPFKLNDEIVYIGELELIYYNGLTPGKIYRTIEMSGRLYDNLGVINDTGHQFIPIWSNFISIKDARKRKLNKISGF